MFENLTKLFRVQPLTAQAKPGKSGGGRARNVQDGGRVPLAVHDSRFLITNGLFQGSRPWVS